MTKGRMASLVLFLALAQLQTLAQSARAGAVRLLRGDNDWGQGWMFLDTDGICKLATAAHVVRGLDGAYAPPQVRDERLRTLTPGKPIVFSVSPDIAVLPLPSAQGEAECGDSRLSGHRAKARAAKLIHPIILTTGRSEIDQVTAEGRARPMDAGGGIIFSVQPTNAADRVAEGWSGSPVVDDEGLIGIVSEVDLKTNEAYAIRVDVIRDMIDAAGTVHPPPAPALRPVGVTVLAGDSPDIANGPDQLLQSAGNGWKVIARSKSIQFSLVLQKPSEAHEVELTLDGPGASSAQNILLETQAEPADRQWASWGYCPLKTRAAGAFTCSVSPRPVDVVRITIHMASPSPLTIKHIALR